MTSISLIPAHTLVKDFYASVSYAYLSKSALEYEDEINRRIDEGLLPLFAKEILRYAMHRGLSKPHFTYNMAYGWYLECTLDQQTRLLWDICGECGIIRGGGSTCSHQIKPERFVAPEPPTMTSIPNSEEIMGDLYGKQH